MPTTEKKQSSTRPIEFRRCEQIDRLLAPLSGREQAWIVGWLSDKYLPRCGAEVTQALRGSAMPEWGDSTRGPDRINPIAQ